MAKTYTLEDYEDLAYEFAIRNPRVIELLKSPLNDKVAKELLSYGIVLPREAIYHEGEYHEKYTLDGLCLDYPHLDRNISEANCESIAKANYSHDVEENCMRCILNPKLKKRFSFTPLETPEQTHARIKGLFTSQQFTALFNNRMFRRYDMSQKKHPKHKDKMLNANMINEIEQDLKLKEALESDAESISFKESNAKGRIKTDIKLVEKYIQKDEYLKLLPKHFSPSEYLRKKIKKYKKWS